MGSLSLGAGSLEMGGEWVGCTEGPGEVAARRDVDVSCRVCTLAVQQLLTWTSRPSPSRGHWAMSVHVTTGGTPGIE